MNSVKLNMTFNFADGEAHSVSFITNFSGRVLRKYIRAADKGIWFHHIDHMALFHGYGRPEYAGYESWTGIHGLD